MVLAREEPPKEVFNVPNPSGLPHSIVGRNTEQTIAELTKHCDFGSRIEVEVAPASVPSPSLPAADVDEVNVEFEKQHAKHKRQRIKIAAALERSIALDKMAEPGPRMKGPPKPPQPPLEPKVQYTAPKETSALAALVAEKLSKTRAESHKDKGLAPQQSLITALSASQSEPLLSGPSVTVSEPEQQSQKFSKTLGGAIASTGYDCNTWHGPNRKGAAAQLHQDLPWEQGPNPATYRPRYDLVRDRRPEWPVTGRPKKSFFDPSTDVYRPHPNADAFLTECRERGVDPVSEARQLDPAELSCRQRALLGLNDQAPAKPVEPMRANSERGELGKVGRANVHFTQITCPAADRDEQDMKTRNLRYPHWDFGAGPPRPNLYKPCSDTDAGKYDVNYVRVDAKIKSGAPMSSEPFGHALPYEKPECLGYCAPTANMHPEHKRGPGVQPDRSLAKDRARLRVCLVNDFDKELPRPPLLAMPSSYHDVNDPVACEKTYQHEMSFDKREFDWYCTTRRDAHHGPSMAKASGRGKLAVQGLRANGPEHLGTRAAAGLGTMCRDTLCALEKTQEQRDARTSRSCRGQGGEYRFDSGNISFNKQTSHPPAYLPVNVSPTKTFAKVAPLQGDARQKCGAFRRTASEGFRSSCRAGALGLPSKKKPAQGPSWYGARSQDWSFEASMTDE